MSFPTGGTMFGCVPEKNVYFLIDTSGSMYHQLPFVKQHLLEVLSKSASTSQDAMFNIVEFKEDVDKWADRLVQCTPTTVNLAARWIDKLCCGTSTNTMAALLEAFNDIAAEAVYMVTDGLPDQRPTVILQHLLSVPHRIPVHSIYLNGTYSDPAAHDFLRDLAEQTRGSFQVVTLSHNGSVQKVVPVYNSKFRYNEYLHDLSFDQSVGSKNNMYLQNSPAYGFSSGPYDKLPLPAVDRIVPLSNMCKNQTLLSRGSNVNSKILDYADAVIEAKCLATSAGIRSCSTPVACSLMKGMKVLARRDQDGLYYLGEVKEQGPQETFVVKFDSCPAMQKPAIQEMFVQHMIAYKDAIRSHVSLGDKVLAPWQQDGRYGPGTVLDGIDRRDSNHEGNHGGQLLVTFFNGETVELQPGIAVRIPPATFERIVRELQLPESQRRKLKFCDQTIPPTYDDQKKEMLHKREKTPVDEMRTRAWEDKKEKYKNNRLRERIDHQIKENSYLLRALDLDNRMDRRDVLGKATSSEIVGYDSGVFSDDSSATSDDESKMTYDDTFRLDEGVGTHNREYDLGTSLRFSLPDTTVLSKSDGQVKKRWRWWSTGTPAKQPPFRETLLEKPREPGEKLTNSTRPGHEEYQTVAGVSFPAGTDRKFGPKPQPWHPYRQFGEKRRENISAVWQRKHLKHSEYQDISGVGFPSATDKKFVRSLDPNWRPETAMANAERSQNWEDGLGHADAEKNSRYNDKLERIRSNRRRYFKDIEDKVAVEEAKEGKRVAFRRNKMNERNENLAEAEDEKNRVQTDRLNARAAKKAEIIKDEKERTDKAERWKTSRIEFKREKQVRYLEIEGNHETEEKTRVAQREARRRERESARREQFHERLREEWRNEDERAEFLRRKNEILQEKTERRQEKVEQTKQARIAAKRERLERYRASILP